ncbi:preprotein translocase subunit SecA [Bradyrhizobium sp. cf659]|uniref:preprotein translocase subunit SecA n=1 Tax=Bradyrhizobium sp. cf659 TaxID=1761771 RepID=UPI0008E4B992|nr:preprotein translocase subunit SecA [Bradyrhizobium sp. cf659]SFI60300.1 protein translocase subunit secA [Bradyrhizobium sp. cf659]
MSRAAIGIDIDDLATGRPYAERLERDPPWHDRAAEFLLATAVRPIRDRLRQPSDALRQILTHVDQHADAFGAATDADLLAVARGMRMPLRREGFVPERVGKCFALIREASARTMGKRHYDTQLMAGWALLQGKLVEMATGEGKTMAATLPAATMALAGYPVHVITVNDYLAKRDADEMRSLYGFLGLSVGAVVQGLPKAERREAYSKSVTYCTNKELAFDYLRDRVAMSRQGSRLHLALDKLRGDAQRDQELVLRGLYFGLVDEADSVFVDEARTPLILSSSVGPGEEARQWEQALELARKLDAPKDYTVNLVERSLSLTATGRSKLEDFTHDLEGVWTSVRAREELVTQALSALMLYLRDQHYVVTEGKVQIVDESTGRVMPDRSWERGLHQAIEVKEGCEPTQRRETLARLTYQRLFRRYIRLAGMTGTAHEVAREIRSVYGLDVVRVPLHQPSRRQYGSERVHATRAEKWRSVASVVENLATCAGRPVLIGTRSVQSSEEISAALSERGIVHALLNAKQDEMEASIIALAGQASRVTVATNMAGRGTDILLDPDVAERGGLHVILTEYHDSRRVDRQLFGRCARQGDAGSCEAIVSLEDDIFTVYAPRVVDLLQRSGVRSNRHFAFLYVGLRRLAQYRAERHAAYVRAQTLKLDRRLDQVLAFAGRGE